MEIGHFDFDVTHAMAGGSCSKVDANYAVKLKLTTTTLASSQACNMKKNKFN